MKTKVKTRRITPGFRLFLSTTPILLAYILFLYKPLTGWAYAFFDYKLGLDLFECEFVGLANFMELFNNPVKLREMKRVLTNTVALSLIGTATSFFPMIYAMFMNEIPFKRFKKLVQTLTTIPNFISWVMVYSFAFAILAVDNGVLNKLLVGLGIIDSGINFLASSEHVWLSMWLYGLWKGLGWGAIVYLSALNGVDQELYEAAQVDGAGRFQKMRYITLPALMPTFITMLIMGIANFLNSGMDKYYVFMNAFNKERIEVLDLYVFNIGISGGEISSATAIGMAKSLIAIMLLFVANWVSGKVRGNKIF